MHIRQSPEWTGLDERLYGLVKTASTNALASTTLAHMHVTLPASLMPWPFTHKALWMQLLESEGFTFGFSFAAHADTIEVSVRMSDLEKK